MHITLLDTTGFRRILRQHVALLSVELLPEIYTRGTLTSNLKIRSYCSFLFFAIITIPVMTWKGGNMNQIWSIVQIIVAWFIIIWIFDYMIGNGLLKEVSNFIQDIRRMRL